MDAIGTTAMVVMVYLSTEEIYYNILLATAKREKRIATIIISGCLESKLSICTFTVN